MKVYIVTSGDYSDYHIDAIFSTEALAKAFLGEGHDRAQIEIFEMDGETDKAYRQYWTCQIFLIDCERNPYHVGPKHGEIGNQGSSWRVAPLSARVPEEQAELVTRQISLQPPPEFGITLESFVSKEHAHKLAVEAYQAFVRIVRERY